MSTINDLTLVDPTKSLKIEYNGYKIQICFTGCVDESNNDQLDTLVFLNVSSDYRTCLERFIHPRIVEDEKELFIARLRSSVISTLSNSINLTLDKENDLALTNKVTEYVEEFIKEEAKHLRQQTPKIEELNKDDVKDTSLTYSFTLKNKTGTQHVNLSIGEIVDDKVEIEAKVSNGKGNVFSGSEIVSVNHLDYNQVYLLLAKVLIGLDVFEEDKDDSVIINTIKDLIGEWKSKNLTENSNEIFEFSNDSFNIEVYNEDSEKEIAICLTHPHCKKLKATKFKFIFSDAKTPVDYYQCVKTIEEEIETLIDKATKLDHIDYACAFSGIADRNNFVLKLLRALYKQFS